ncbi:Sodium Bile acid symporter family protein [Rosistilla ulvae]|uniref:Sodium Bile acid symporter family protein n=1 Tax=Rosistilla ulvae TaxID=1930277 RepID=A0A517LWQ0_9BACT|nr:bile acid:sodium symporter family protein [Rosistilla ulvae]QDS87064.1 Sodium Bile acid symporter family protein [Rosistilla ulvae]
MNIGWITVGILLVAAILTLRFFRSLAFTAWVLVGVSAAFFFPAAFQTWWGLPLASLIVPLIQLIMFGMGTTLNLGDFLRIVKEPWPVLLGISLQYAVMPITGYMLVVAFGLEGELAAGVILIGACSGGVASNVMSYIGNGNVALSVTMTAFSTIVAPVMTPLAMTVLAGQYIDVDAFAMLIGVVNIVIAPVFAGVVGNAILYSKKPWCQRTGTLLGVAAMLVAVGTAIALVPADQLGAFNALRNCVSLGLYLIAALAIVKVIFLARGSDNEAWLDRGLPILSMAGICAILTVLTAQTHDVLVQAAGVLFAAAVIHNTIGLSLGYWGARVVGVLAGRIGFRIGMFPNSQPRLTERDCRTVAFEVGMQNGGMATGLAINVLHSHVVALPPNVFGTWMHISGSILANYWKRDSSPEESPATVTSLEAELA